MDQLLTSLVYGGALSLLAVALVKGVKQASRPPTPPGPKRYPLIGNILDLPSKRGWVHYQAMAEKYGDIIYLEVFGQPILILSSMKRVHDLFEKRSSNYSDRPQPTMLCELMNYRHLLSVMPYGDEWKLQRKVFHQHFQPNNPSLWHPIIVKQTRNYLKGLSRSPEEWATHAKQLFSAIIVEITYGVETESPEDPFISTMTEVANGFGEACLPGRFLVDTIPILKYVPSWFPGAGFQKFAAYYKAMEERSRYEPFEHVLETMRNGASSPCMVTSMVEDLPEEGDPSRAKAEDVARSVAAVTHGAGSDTTLGSALAFFVLVALHPEVQRKAQQELDEVVGFGRVPDFSDRERLVYTTAIAKEVSRYHQTMPMGFPHSTTHDDIYDGYFIPKGTIVMGNAWHIMHDPELFEDPMSFKPERYIKNGRIDPTVLDPNDAAFGFGRRICPGRFVSGDSLFLMIASTLAYFDVVPPTDETGRPTIKYEQSDRSMSHPEPFECFLRPRSRTSEDLFRHL
ncbi:cytochrome P450 [Coprinopsis cinerea AmutBmut pab1-1]|nr:cytochrome P450 [Coprinopsis cinerea AmutBmut pab1-1]